jgi:tetratricopeptide (TPR) repeat protein
MKKHCILFAFLVTACFCFCKNGETRGMIPSTTSVKEDSGTIYALVVGVSKYEDLNMPQLQYADSDAVYFTKFLRSGAMGIADSVNIKLLTNEAATDNNIKKERAWILRRLKPGDKVYIYLSGHGDAINSEAIYFLSHNTPKVSDKEEYTAVSGINLLEMQTVIKMFIEKQAKVFLISDFCRTNELVGKNNSSRFLYSNVIGQEIPGLTKMVSCSADEFSFEDKKWGNGRGVFSFYLINGLLGLADNPATPDGKVSLQELKTYVEDNVGNDTKSPTTGEPRQTPDFKGDKQILSKVNMQAKNALLAQKGNNSDYLAMFTKGNKLDDATDAALYQHFMTAINEERFIEPFGNNAKHYLDQILAITTDKITQADLTDIFIAAVLDKGQKPINYYSQGLLDSIKFNYQYFIDASKYFEAALPYLKQNKELFTIANASRLFLLASAMQESREKEDWERGLLLADSSLTLQRWAYTFHTKGLLYFRLGLNDSIIDMDRTALSLAPNFMFAYLGIGVVFHNLNQTDSAKWYYRKALEINPKYDNAYRNLGIIFHNLNQTDSAIWYYRKVLEINPKAYNAYNNLGNVFEGLNQIDSAIWYYRKALEIDSIPYNDASINLGNVFYYLNQMDSAIWCYRKALEINPKSKLANNNLAIVFKGLNQTDSAIWYYRKVLEINPKANNAYNNLGDVFEGLNQIDSAIWYYRKALEINSKSEDAYNNLGVVFHKLNQIDSAVWYYRKALEINPKYEYANNSLGDVFKGLNQTDSAIWYYRKALETNPKSEYAYNNLAIVFKGLNQTDSAIWYYRKVIELNPMRETAINGLAYEFKHLQSYDSAAYYLTLNIANHPNRANCYDSYGELLKDMGKTPEAIEQYEKAIAINPKHKSSLLALLELYKLNVNANRAEEIQRLLNNLK